MARPGGALAVGRHLPGRGAWLCRGSETCLDAATRRKAFPKALRAEVTPEAIARLRDDLAGRGRIEASTSD